MKIVCDTAFKHGRETFEKDDQRTIADELGAYFIQNGWAHKFGDQPSEIAPASDVTLDVNNAVHKHGVSHG